MEEVVDGQNHTYSLFIAPGYAIITRMGLRNGKIQTYRYCMTRKKTLLAR